MFSYIYLWDWEHVYRCIVKLLWLLIDNISQQCDWQCFMNVCAEEINKNEPCVLTL